MQYILFAISASKEAKALRGMQVGFYFGLFHNSGCWKTQIAVATSFVFSLSN
jgi:hypothetical protein